MDLLKGDHGTVETVKIKHDLVDGNDSGFVEINKHEFDKEKHELFEAPAKAPVKKK